jgi:hypothetical protein
MDAAAIASHMLDLYEKGTLTDTVINVSGVVFRVHRVRDLDSAVHHHSSTCFAYTLMRAGHIVVVGLLQCIASGVVGTAGG